MKFLRILPVAAIACLAVSCQNGSGNLSSNSSASDSLMYYLGQMHAGDYLREANRDTLLKSQTEKDAYLLGLQKGLDALQDGNENYNRGVMMGMQMASQIMSFSEQMGVKINKQAYVASITNALNADTIPNYAEVQKGFREVMANIEAAKTAKDKAESQASLKQVAEKDGFPMINDDLYGKVTVSNDSVALAKDDEVTVEATLSKEDGEPLQMPLSPKGKVGNDRNFPSIISDALLTLKSGESGEFLTTAHALLGQRAAQMNLEPKTVIKMNLKATLVPKAEDKEAK